jgi:hypothetical protein
MPGIFQMVLAIRCRPKCLASLFPVFRQQYPSDLLDKDEELRHLEVHDDQEMHNRIDTVPKRTLPEL